MARIACSVSQRSGLRPSLRRRRRNAPIAVATTALLSFTSTLVYPPAQSRFCHAPREKFNTVSANGHGSDVLPNDASQVRRVETRQAFFAGVALLFALVTHKASGNDDAEPSAEELLLMDEIYAELSEWGEAFDIVQGVAVPRKES
jgi:hypothetical protein